MTMKITDLAQRVGVHGFVVDKQERILILKRSSSDPDEPDTWDTPGGGNDYPETVEEGFKREVREETGLKVNDIRIVSAYTLDDQTLQLFVISELVNGEVKLSHEHNDFRWVTLEEFLSLDNAGLHVKAIQFLLQNNRKVAIYPEYITPLS